MADKTIVAVIQGRMGSSRLPGKVLLPIGVKPMLRHVIERVSAADQISKVIVATSNDPADDPIEGFCLGAGVECFRGSLHDVLDRFYQACLPWNADLVVRVTADCPFLDPLIIDQTITEAIKGDYDFVANRLPPPYQRTFPIGLDVEVCKFSALQTAWRDARETYAREHVMPYLYEKVELTQKRLNLRTGVSQTGFRVAVLDLPGDFGALRWTVDTPEDLKFANAVANSFDLKQTNWQALSAFLENHPEISEINALVRHKTLKEIDHRILKPLVTLFTSPKPFTDPHISLIQTNAILSWTQIPEVKIILFGEEPGLEEFASKHGLQHIQQIARSESGAPMMDDMFRQVREISDTPFYCVINADIILFSDFVRRLVDLANKPERFVIFGQRFDLDLVKEINFGTNWEADLKKEMESRATLHRPAGSDYFLFPAACYREIPAFVIGRAGWDNWMIFHARNQGFPAVDATSEINIVHQNHDYAHLPGKRPHYDHPETHINIDRAGGRIITRFTIWDADWRWVGNKLLRNKWRLKSLWRWFESYPYLRWNNIKLSNRLWRLGKILGFYK